MSHIFLRMEQTQVVIVVINEVIVVHGMKYRNADKKDPTFHLIPF